MEIFPSADYIRESIVQKVSQYSREAIQLRGCFVLAVSGGSVPSFLSTLASCSDIEFDKWKIGFVDERMVPLNHEESNYRALKDNFLDKFENEFPGIVLIVDRSSDAASAALQYERALQAALDSPTIVFDLAILGMGPDGHTASLFPGHSLSGYVGDRQVLEILDSPKPPPERITLSLATINNSRAVMFVVTGMSKANTVHEIFQLGDEGKFVVASSDLPASRISTRDSPVIWLLDEAAASLIAAK